MMRLCFAATMIAFGIACATHEKTVPLETEIVTFPDGAIVQYRGHSVGRAPAKIILPQDVHGRLTERTEVRAVPNTDQSTLYAQSRILDPAKQSDRIPNRIMIDMTLRGTNMPPVQAGTTNGMAATRAVSKNKPKKVERSKPTQAVGLDRWNPGIY